MYYDQTKDAVKVLVIACVVAVIVVFTPLLIFPPSASTAAPADYPETTAPDHPEATAILNSISCSDHGSNLDEFLTEAPTCEWLIYAFFDQNGQKLVEYTYEDPYWVALPEAIYSYLLQYDDLTLVISRPALDTGFEDVDLSFPIRKGLQNHIASMVMIGKKQVYHLDKSESGHWPQSLEVSDYIKELEEDSSRGVWICLVDGTGMEQVYLSGQAVDKIADRCGLQYYAEPYHIDNQPE